MRGAHEVPVGAEDAAVRQIQGLHEEERQVMMRTSTTHHLNKHCVLSSSMMHQGVRTTILKINSKQTLFFILKPALASVLSIIKKWVLKGNVAPVGVLVAIEALSHFVTVKTFNT